MASEAIIYFDVKWNLEETECKECSCCGKLIIDDQFRMSLIPLNSTKKINPSTGVILCLDCFTSIGSEQ